MLKVFQERRQVVSAKLVVAVGDQSLCATAKSGHEIPAAKYYEGRMAVLMEIERACDHGEPISAAAERIGRYWDRALKDVIRRAASRDWVAYRSGGVDEAAEFLSNG